MASICRLPGYHCLNLICFCYSFSSGKNPTSISNPKLNLQNHKAISRSPPNMLKWCPIPLKMRPILPQTQCPSAIRRINSSESKTHDNTPKTLQKLQIENERNRKRRWNASTRTSICHKETCLSRGGRKAENIYVEKIKGEEMTVSFLHKIE